MEDYKVRKKEEDLWGRICEYEVRDISRFHMTFVRRKKLWRN